LGLVSSGDIASGDNFEPAFNCRLWPLGESFEDHRACFCAALLIVSCEVSSVFTFALTSTTAKVGRTLV